MPQYRYAVTHPGRAHRDDFLSSCLVFALGLVDEIHRRQPTSAELEDDKILVFDVGDRHEPALGNFDHHQFSRDAEPACALSLLTEHYGHDGLALLPWYNSTVTLDSKGPMALAAQLGLERLPVELESPIEKVLLYIFSDLHSVNNRFATAAIGLLMQTIGGRIVDQAEELRANLKRCRDTSVRFDVSGLPVLLVHDSKGAKAIKEFMQTGPRDCAITITPDDRGPGWSLFRVDDHPAVDFLKLKDHEAITFAHANGFIAKTKERLALHDIARLLELAIDG